jgi:CubicO group peptidase (beta-lactamase class C family)
MALVENSSGTHLLARGHAVDTPANNGPMLTPQLRIRIGSITKTFTATVALQLADWPFPYALGRPKLNLDTTIDQYLQPELFPPPDLPYLAQLSPALVPHSNRICRR